MIETVGNRSWIRSKSVIPQMVIASSWLKQRVPSLKTIVADQAAAQSRQVFDRRLGPYNRFVALSSAHPFIGQFVGDRPYFVGYQFFQ